MCSSASNREADSSDDDFDYSLQKRLRTDCIKQKRTSKRQRKSARHTHARAISSFTSAVNNDGFSSSVTDDVKCSTSTVLHSATDISISSTDIINDVLDNGECDDDDMTCVVEPWASASDSSIRKPIEVSSPKKQSSLLEFFKVERNSIVVTKEASTSASTTSTRRKRGSINISNDVKMYQSEGSNQLVFVKPDIVKNNLFYNKARDKVKRDCPFYKKIPGTSITVDAFQYGNIPDCSAYFLSHFHSDHYSGLTKHFQNPVYCSLATGNLVRKKLRVASEYIHRLPLSTPTTIGNVQVILFDANHCPGSVMFLFILPSGKAYLHTGDFRACEEMERIPILNTIHIDHLYLDTTYCNSAYDFPSQDEAISFVVQKAREAVDSNPNTLIVCGTYTIGKEKIFIAIAEQLGSKVFVSEDKRATLDCLESKDILDVLTTEDSNSRIHVLPMMKITLKGMNEYLKKYSHRFNSVLGFKPTGWTCKGSVCSLSTIKPQISGRVTIYGVPYSEHSSFSELKRFVQFIRPAKVIPTVFGGAGQRISDMQTIFKEWLRN